MTYITDKKHLMLKVAKKEVENPEFATLFFNYSIDFVPGQFVMLWIPEVDEKPYTISYHSKNSFGITIEAKGIFSKRAIQLKEGDLVGVRGCFGNGFKKYSKNAAFIAGGCGIAPLATLIEQYSDSITFIQGAKSKDYLLYPGRFKNKVQYCTDDGSSGFKGFVTELFEKELISGKKFEMVYACGPEIMMNAVFKICEKNNIPCQISLERYMRCGFGVCGACVCGKEVVCKDGPVFESKKLKQMKDFNKTALLKSGKEVGLDEYFAWRRN